MTGIILRMGGIVEQQFSDAIASLTKRDPELATLVINEDINVDQLEHEIHHLVTRLLALRQPMADDLRLITASLKISGDIERIGDYAANIAKRSSVISQVGPMKPADIVPRMAQIVQSMITDVLNAYLEQNEDKARAVWLQDERVDETYNNAFSEMLTYMMEDPQHITPCTHLLFIAKNIERIGDHVTNIAEMISFIVTGNPIADERPKGDTTPFETDPNFNINDTNSKKVKR